MGVYGVATCGNGHMPERDIDGFSSKLVLF
jgi:hypothetical protein